jgi:hypothetical protein
MARGYKIKDGTTTIDLISPTGIIANRGGYPRMDLADETMEVASSGDSGWATDDFSLNVIGTSHNDISSKVQALNLLLRKASQFKHNSSQITPVYVEAQTASETNPRFALVKGRKGGKLPDVLNHPFELDNWLDSLPLMIERESLWRSHAPGTLPTVATLTQIVGSPAAPTEVFLANHCDLTDVATIKRFDASAGTYSANLAGTTGWKLFPDPVEANDCLRIRFAKPAHHIVLPIKTAADWNVTLVAEYWNGAFVAATEGSKHTRWPTGTASQLFNAAGDWVVNLGNVADWASMVLDGDAGYWIQVRASVVTSQVTIPVCSDGYAPYCPRYSGFELPAAASKGDASPLLLLRFRSPIGGALTPVLGTLSQIVVGAKKDNLDTFRPALNCGNQDNPAGWAATYDADTSSVADPNYPGAYRARTTFATVATELARVTFAGTSKLAAWPGRYRAILRVQQVGGAAGDCSVRLRMRIGGSTDAYPVYNTDLKALKTKDAGLELVDLGELRIPLTLRDPDDPLSANVYFECAAKRASGASVLDWADLWLMPCEDYYAQYENLLASTTGGNAALRGDNGLDIDPGLLCRRAVKTLISGTDLIPGETWKCTHFANKIDPATRYRFYVLMAHYPSAGWGQSPWIASLGCMLSVKAYVVNRYQALRGDQ